MQRIRIGVDLSSLNLPIRRALAEAERLGAGGVQLAAVGDLSPKVLSHTGRRELLHLLASHSLQLAAFECPLRHGLDWAEGLDARIEYLRRALGLSFDLGARRVVVQAGRIPVPEDEPRTRLMTEALVALGHHGDRTGTVLALETGSEAGTNLSGFLEQFDTGGLGACLNPGSQLSSGSNPYDGARALRHRVVYSYAQDFRQVGANRQAQEVPLGAGQVDWMQYLSVLEEIEYDGWLTVRRQTGDNRLGDLAGGVNVLQRFVRGE
jgi:sugar phosphate isomerase/epimerase